MLVVNVDIRKGYAYRTINICQKCMIICNGSLKGELYCNITIGGEINYM